jgi:hypothetical protein
VRCRHVYVDVCPNDSADIKCGGDPVLGFDFYVDPSEKPQDIKKFIVDKLAGHGITPECVFVGRPIEHGFVSRLWTRRRIALCINKDAKFLAGEIERSRRCI